MTLPRHAASMTEFIRRLAGPPFRSALGVMLVGILVMGCQSSTSVDDLDSGVTSTTSSTTDDDTSAASSDETESVVSSDDCESNTGVADLWAGLTGDSIDIARQRTNVLLEPESRVVSKPRSR